MICKSCTSILLQEEHKESFYHALRKSNLTYLQKKALRKCIYDACRKVKTCLKCGEHNGMVKTVGLFRIAHDRSQQGWRNEAVLQEGVEAFDSAIKANPEVSSLPNKTYDVLNPLIVHELFQRIEDCDNPLLLMNPEGSWSEDLILTRIFVPPIYIRPPVVSDLKVAVPIHVAKTMTYPEKVCPANLALMQQLIRNGCDVHPGANFIKIVQFIYSDDNLGPVVMGGTEQPVEYNHMIIHVKAILASESRPLAITYWRTGRAVQQLSEWETEQLWKSLNCSDASLLSNPSVYRVFSEIL